MQNEKQQLTEIKRELQAVIRTNSDRGFVPYDGCIRVGEEMLAIVDRAEALDEGLAFDVVVTVFLEGVKLLDHADDSSGALGDVIVRCTSVLSRLCSLAGEAHTADYFSKLIQMAGSKSVKEWPDFGYQLLHSMVPLINDQKQAQQVYDTFEALGPLREGKKYPEEYLITRSIIERLEGKAAADQYVMEHVEVPELCVIAVEQAIVNQQYELAEQLSTQALRLEGRWKLKSSVWPFYLEKIYTATSNIEKLTEMVHLILVHGHPSYYAKLKQLYETQGIWNQKRGPLLNELSTALPENEYASVLIEAGEFQRLLDLMSRHKYLIQHYGEQVAEQNSEAAFEIYEDYITGQLQEAGDRRKYRAACRLIHNYYKLGAKTQAVQLIDRLGGMYPQRSALLDELEKLRVKLVRVG